jgi:hypothetical protein
MSSELGVLWFAPEGWRRHGTPSQAVRFRELAAVTPAPETTRNPNPEDLVNRLVVRANPRKTIKAKAKPTVGACATDENRLRKKDMQAGESIVQTK